MFFSKKKPQNDDITSGKNMLYLQLQRDNFLSEYDPKFGQGRILFATRNICSWQLDASRTNSSLVAPDWNILNCNNQGHFRVHNVVKLDRRNPCCKILWIWENIELCVVCFPRERCLITLKYRRFSYYTTNLVDWHCFWTREIFQ